MSPLSCWITDLLIEMVFSSKNQHIAVRRRNYVLLTILKILKSSPSAMKRNTNIGRVGTPDTMIFLHEPICLSNFAERAYSAILRQSFLSNKKLRIVNVVACGFKPNPAQTSSSFRSRKIEEKCKIYVQSPAIVSLGWFPTYLPQGRYSCLQTFLLFFKCADQ